MSKITAYFRQITETSSKQTNFKTPIEKFFSYEHPFFTQFASQSIFNNALLFKNAQISRDLANILILEDGDLNRTLIDDCITFLENNLFSIKEDCEYENLHRQHILFILKKLSEDKNFSRQLNKLFLPTQNYIQKLILDTLLLPKNTVLSSTHVKRAVLSALFTYLRQDIGSCFATAPAILIQQQYPEKMLKDLDDLLSSGSLLRTIKGNPITIPINLLNSLGSLHTPILVKKLGHSPIVTLAKDPSLQSVFFRINLIHKQTVDPLKECLELLNTPSIQSLCKNPDNYITANEIICLALTYYYKLPSTKSLLQPNDLNIEDKNSSYFSNFLTAKETFIHTTHNALLKSWELSLASLAEAKATFSKQHLAVALGIGNFQDSFSLTSILNHAINQEVLTINQDILAAESKYNNLKGQVDYIDTRLKHPINRQDTENLIAEFRLRRQELNRVLSEWDEYQDKQRQLQSLKNFMLNYYLENFSIYFQGIYDPEITVVDTNFYEDTLAGFRFFYTYGRKNVGTWNPLYSGNEFITALSNFFSVTEMELKDTKFSRKLGKEIERCVGEILSSIHRYDFLLGAFQRLAHFYNETLPDNPMDNLSMIKHKPWVYVSGGSPSSFLKVYFELEETPTYLVKQAESPQELLAFFADSTKDLPTAIKNYYLDQNKSLFLASSPTHLFLIDPANKMFRKCWDNDWYSYTWIRDVWETQQKDFLEKILLNKGAISRLLEEVQAEIIGNFSYKSLLNEVFQDLNLTIPEFYEKTLKCFKQNKISTSTRIETDLASLLFNLVPITQEQQLKENIDNISQKISYSSKVSYQKFQNLIEQLVPKFSYITSKELLFLYKLLVIEASRSLYFNEDFHYRIINAMRELSLLFPAPLLLGDSNWGTKYGYFGFSVHPGTQEIDFWQFSPEGSSGTPMPNWKNFFNGKHYWRFFSKPEYYGFAPGLEEKLKLDLI